MSRSYNGTTDKIDCGTSLLLLPATALTFATQFYPSTLSFPNSNGAYAAVGGRNNGANQAYIAYLKSSGAMAWYGGTGSALDPGSGTISGANTWNHIAYVITGYTTVNGATGYINGVADGSWNTQGHADYSAAFQIGADGANPGTFNFPGRIAETAVWSVALTVSEIAALSKGARACTVRPASIVGYWALDGIASPEPDFSGNALNGTVTGTALAAGPPIAMFTRRMPRFETPAVVFARNTMPFMLKKAMPNLGLSRHV